MHIVCVLMCMYVCVHSYVYVCVCTHNVYVCVCTHMCMYVCARIRMCVRVYTVVVFKNCWPVSTTYLPT